MIQKQPENFIAYNLLGGVYASENKYDDAIAAYQKAVKIKPAWPNSYRNLAIVHLVQKNKEAAIKTLTTGITDTKGAIELVSDLAVLYNRDGDHQKVIALYEDLYKQHPDSLLAVNNLASYLSDFAPDKAGLERAAELAEPLEKTNQPEMMDTVAWIAYKQGDYEKAQKLLLKVLELNPNATVSHYHLGMVYFKQGDKIHARESLEKAVNTKTDFTGLAEARETLKSITEAK
jgi:tetratricopeptide (TPR) repeat protein